MKSEKGRLVSIIQGRREEKRSAKMERVKVKRWKEGETEREEEAIAGRRWRRAKWERGRREGDMRRGKVRGGWGGGWRG